MKKEKKVNGKLAIDKKDVKELDDGELADIAGGALTPTAVTACWYTSQSGCTTWSCSKCGACVPS